MPKQPNVCDLVTLASSLISPQDGGGGRQRGVSWPRASAPLPWPMSRPSHPETPLKYQEKWKAANVKSSKMLFRVEFIGDSLKDVICLLIDPRIMPTLVRLYITCRVLRRPQSTTYSGCERCSEVTLAHPASFRVVWDQSQRSCRVMKSYLKRDRKPVSLLRVKE